MSSLTDICNIEVEILTTERLVLRQPHKDDVEDMALLANNFEVARNLTRLPYPYFDADARDFLKSLSSEGDGGCTFAITKAENGRLIGVCGLHESNSKNEFPFMGYWLGEPYWGQGFATEVASALIDLFFKTTDRETMMASCFIENSASRRVIEKCGGQYWKPGEVFSNALGKTQKIDHYKISRQSWMEALAA